MGLLAAEVRYLVGDTRLTQGRVGTTGIQVCK